MREEIELTDFSYRIINKLTKTCHLTFTFSLKGILYTMYASTSNASFLEPNLQHSIDSVGEKCPLCNSSILADINQMTGYNMCSFSNKNELLEEIFFHILPSHSLFESCRIRMALNKEGSRFLLDLIEENKK